MAGDTASVPARRGAGSPGAAAAFAGVAAPWIALALLFTLFRIGDDGKLTFARSYDIATNGRFMWWMGMVTV